MATFSTHGPVQGDCGHRHRSMETANRCLHHDAARCRQQGGYSDRRIVGIAADAALYNLHTGEYIPGPGSRVSRVGSASAGLAGRVACARRI